MTTSSSAAETDIIWDLLRPLPDDVDWSLALCAQTDPEAFYVDKGGNPDPAKRVCAACEIRRECLDYALAHDERFGIWGGLSERERRGLRQQRRMTTGGKALTQPPSAGEVGE